MYVTGYLFTNSVALWHLLFNCAIEITLLSYLLTSLITYYMFERQTTITWRFIPQANANLRTEIKNWQRRPSEDWGFVQRCAFLLFVLELLCAKTQSISNAHVAYVRNLIAAHSYVDERSTVGPYKFTVSEWLYIGLRPYFYYSQ